MQEYITTLTPCDFCDSTKNVLKDHYEKHIDPPRKVNICRSCHTKIHAKNRDHSKYKKMKKIIRNGIIFEERHISTFVVMKKYKQYTITLPPKFVRKLPSDEIYLVVVGCIILIIPDSKTVLELLPVLPKLYYYVESKIKNRSK